MKNIFKLFFSNNDAPIGLISLGITNDGKYQKDNFTLERFSDAPGIFQHNNLNNSFRLRTIADIIDFD